jgi:putative FmdB family regulatory protein
VPIFEYRCLECQRDYEVFHKGRELLEDVVCPGCGSLQARKLMSVAAIAAHGASRPAPEGCAGDDRGGCCGGSCGMG